MLIRKYIPSDCKPITELFYHTVHTINARDYTRQQLAAWATGNVDLEEWNQSFLAHNTIVAVKDSIIVGFGDIDASGYLDRLYVHKDYQGQGIGGAICDKLEGGVEVNRIITYASITAKSFFVHRGYEIIKEQQVIRKGICLTNYVMRKSMDKELSC